MKAAGHTLVEVLVAVALGAGVVMLAFTLDGDVRRFMQKASTEADFAVRLEALDGFFMRVIEHAGGIDGAISGSWHLLRLASVGGRTCLDEGNAEDALVLEIYPETSSTAASEMRCRQSGAVTGVFGVMDNVEQLVFSFGIDDDGDGREDRSTVQRDPDDAGRVVSVQVMAILKAWRPGPMRDDTQWTRLAVLLPALSPIDVRDGFLRVLFMRIYQVRNR